MGSYLSIHLLFLSFVDKTTEEQDDKINTARLEA